MVGDRWSVVSRIELYIVVVYNLYSKFFWGGISFLNFYIHLDPPPNIAIFFPCVMYTDQ